MVNDSVEEIVIYCLDKESPREEGSNEKCLDITLALIPIEGWEIRDKKILSKKEFSKLNTFGLYAKFGITNFSPKPGYPLGPTYHDNIHGIDDVYYSFSKERGE